MQSAILSSRRARKGLTPNGMGDNLGTAWVVLNAYKGPQTEAEHLRRDLSCREN